MKKRKEGISQFAVYFIIYRITKISCDQHIFVKINFHFQTDAIIIIIIIQYKITLMQVFFS